MGIETGTPAAAEIAPPSLEEVQAHFTQTGYPDTEATLFFNHYEAVGWKLGGKAPITNWQAAAAKWMDYAKNIKQQLNEKPGKYNGTEHLHVQQNKDYSQPL